MKQVLISTALFILLIVPRTVGQSEKTSQAELDKDLMKAVGSLDADRVRQLLAAGANPNHRNPETKTPVLIAAMTKMRFSLQGAMSGKVDSIGTPEVANVVELLLKAGADVNTTDDEGNVALAAAVARPGDETVLANVLIEAGADVNAKSGNDLSILGYAALHGKTSLAKLLISRGADINALDSSTIPPIVAAAYNGHANIVTMLMNKGADIDAYSPLGTALILSTYKRHPKVTKMLLDKGADVNATDQNGNTALMAASHNGSLDIAEVLIDQGAKVNHSNSKGDTALLLAAAEGKTEVARLLITKGAEVNIVAQYGNTPLLMAACRGHLETAELLLDSGADLTSKNHEGITALSGAQKQGHANVVKLLQAAPAMRRTRNTRFIAQESAIKVGSSVYSLMNVMKLRLKAAPYTERSEQEFSMGQEFEVVRIEQDWIRVRASETNIEGWIHRATVCSSAKQAEQLKKTKAIPTAIHFYYDIKEDSDAYVMILEGTLRLRMIEEHTCIVFNDEPALATSEFSLKSLFGVDQVIRSPKPWRLYMYTSDRGEFQLISELISEKKSSAAQQILIRLSKARYKAQGRPLRLEVIKGSYSLVSGAECWAGSDVHVSEDWLTFPEGLEIEVGAGGIRLNGIFYPEGCKLHVDSRGELSQTRESDNEGAIKNRQK